MYRKASVGVIGFHWKDYALVFREAAVRAGSACDCRVLASCVAGGDHRPGQYVGFIVRVGLSVDASLEEVVHLDLTGRSWTEAVQLIAEAMQDLINREAIKLIGA